MEATPPDFSKAEFDPAWGSPPLEIHDGLLRWNASRWIYELRRATPRRGTSERYQYDELEARERKGVFIQAYADPGAPGGWSFRWVRVSTPYPQEGRPYTVLGAVEDLFARPEGEVRAAPIGRLDLDRGGAVGVGAQVAPVADLAAGPVADGERFQVPEGGAATVLGGAEFAFGREGQDEAVAGGRVGQDEALAGDLGGAAQIGADLGEALFEHGEDRYQSPSTVGETSDYVWVPNKELPSKCPYPHALMPVPIADYESGRWLEPDYVPSRALPKPYDEPEWPCTYEATVFEGRKSIGRIVDFREPEVPEAPPQRFAPMPLEELDEPEPVEEAELDVFAASVHSALFPGAEPVLIAGSAQVQTALADLDAPLFGFKDYQPPTAGQPTSTDLTAFAWIPQRDLPYGCPYPHSYLPVPQEDYASGAWLMPTYVPSIPLPHPYDLTPWRCGQVVGGESGRGKGDPPRQRHDSDEPSDAERHVVGSGSPYEGLIRSKPPAKPKRGGFGDRETDEAVDKDKTVQKLRKKRDELQAHIDALRDSGQAVPAGLTAQHESVGAALYKRENRVARAFNRRRAKELRIERAKLEYELSTTGNVDKRMALETKLLPYEAQIDFREGMVDLFSWFISREGGSGYGEQGLPQVGQSPAPVAGGDHRSPGGIPVSGMSVEQLLAEERRLRTLAFDVAEGVTPLDEVERLQNDLRAVLAALANKGVGGRYAGEPTAGSGASDEAWERGGPPSEQVRDFEEDVSRAGSRELQETIEDTARALRKLHEYWYGRGGPGGFGDGFEAQLSHALRSPPWTLDPRLAQYAHALLEALRNTGEGLDGVLTDLYRLQDALRSGQDMDTVGAGFAAALVKLDGMKNVALTLGLVHDVTVRALDMAESASGSLWPPTGAGMDALVYEKEVRALEPLLVTLAEETVALSIGVESAGPAARISVALRDYESASPGDATIKAAAFGSEVAASIMRELGFAAATTIGVGAVLRGAVSVLSASRTARIARAVIPGGRLRRSEGILSLKSGQPAHPMIHVSRPDLARDAITQLLRRRENERTRRYASVIFEGREDELVARTLIQNRAVIQEWVEGGSGQLSMLVKSRDFKSVIGLGRLRNTSQVDELRHVTVVLSKSSGHSGGIHVQTAFASRP